jgi:CheY-like chemotaxis protein
VVEDEAIVARDIAWTLGGLGYRVVARALTGEDAIGKARAGRPDLVLMDICLGGSLDGIAAATIIRSELGIPVIFLSAFSDDETLERAKAAEPFGYLVKPFKERDLRCAIEVALHRHRLEAVAAPRSRERPITAMAAAEISMTLRCAVADCGPPVFASHGIDLALVPAEVETEVPAEVNVFCVGGLACLHGSALVVIGTTEGFLVRSNRTTADPSDWLTELLNQLIGRVKNRISSAGVLVERLPLLAIDGLHAMGLRVMAHQRPLVLSDGTDSVFIWIECQRALNVDPDAPGSPNILLAEGELVLF